MGGKRTSFELAKKIREDYVSDESSTYEYLSHKYEKSVEHIRKIINNEICFDNDYVPIKKKSGGSKHKVYIPEETILLRDTPMTTLYEARGHNHVIHVAK